MNPPNKKRGRQRKNNIPSSQPPSSPYSQPPSSTAQPPSSPSQPASSPSQPPSSPYYQSASSTSQPSSQPSPLSNAHDVSASLTAMKRLKIRKRREITQKPAHPIREAMPTLLLAMALITSPTTVITTNDRYDTASLYPTRSARFRRSSALQPTVQVQTECVSEPALST